MRFSYDDLLDSSDEEGDYETFITRSSSPCSSAGPSFNDVSFVNPNEEDENVPHLYLPKRDSLAFTLAKQEPLEEPAVEQLDPELEQLIGKLNLQAKSPYVERAPLPLIKSGNKSLANSEPSVSRGKDDNTYAFDSQRMISAIQNSFATRLRTLELDNKKQVEEIKLRKKKLEAERKRKEEEERKRREEEERRKREEEAARLRKVEQERKQKEEAFKLKKQKEEAQEQAEKAKKEAEERDRLKQQAIRAKTVSDFSTIEKKFWEYKEKISSIKKEIVEPIKKADPSLKTLLSRHKRKVNPKFGQLTNSNTQLQTIHQELCNLVDQTKDNKLAYLWILNFIAKATVHQAETEVRVKPESALPLAKLAVNLMVRYEELHDLLMARLVKKCPFVIGFTCNIDTESGRQNMGWKRKADDKWEEDTSYDERMGGMVTLYAVITRIPLPPEIISTHSHPMPISGSWHMLARIANTQGNLLTNSHFVILGSWWDAAAAQFLQAYGNQGSKLLQLLGDGLTSAVADRKYVGAARLRILLEEWQTTGIKSFPEMVV